MSILDGFRKTQDIIDWEFKIDVSQRAYLKKMAIDTVLNFVGRTMSTVKIELRQDNKKEQSKWNYLLNVRPNKDSSAADFWQKVFYKLLFDNEVLIIKSDDDQLLIADDFYREEYAFYDDTFNSVTVKNYNYDRTFKMQDVIYLQYNNDKLDEFTTGLFADYGELFGRMLEVSMRNNQIRAGVSMDMTGNFNDEGDRKKKLKDYLDRMFASFSKSSVAIVPISKGFSYEEYSNKQGVTNQSLQELDDIKKSLVADVARAIGVPPALILAETADLDSNLKSSKKLCFEPLIKSLEDELNAKIISQSEFEKGKKFRVYGVLMPDIFEIATPIEKLVGSGPFTFNDILEELGRNRVDKPEMDEQWITKNFEKLKGGEEE